MKRRSFIQGVIAGLTALFISKRKACGLSVKEGREKVSPDFNSYPVKSRQKQNPIFNSSLIVYEGGSHKAYYLGYYWHAKGNVIRWGTDNNLTDEFPLPLRNGYHWCILPTNEYCIGLNFLSPKEGTLSWYGDGKELWKILPTERKDMFQFQRIS